MKMNVQLRERPLAEYIAMVVVVLMAVGTVFVYSASASVSQRFSLERFYEFAALRKILFFPLAVMVMYVFSLFDYRRLDLSRRWFKSFTVYLLSLSLVLLVLVLIPGIGVEKFYARRWFEIPLGPFKVSFQPSELAKWSVVIFLAACCSRFAGQMGQYRRRFLPACLVIAAAAGLIITEDFGTAIFVILVGFTVLLAGGARFSHILTFVPFGLVGFVIVLMRSPGRLARLAAFLEPGKWADSVAYQASQSLITLGSGGLFGRGLGRGIFKYGHLPEDTTDFIFAIIGEELGLVGCMGVIALFVVFVWLGVLVVMRCRDDFGRLLAGGIVLTIALQAAFNIGVVTVVLPTKGIPLPFISAGGTNMLLSAAAVGVLLNIARQTATADRTDTQV